MPNIVSLVRVNDCIDLVEGGTILALAMVGIRRMRRDYPPNIVSVLVPVGVERVLRELERRSKQFDTHVHHPADSSNLGCRLRARLESANLNDAVAWFPSFNNNGNHLFSMPTEETRTLQSVERALDIIDVLAEAAEPLGVTDLSEHIDLPTSTLYVHLQTLYEKNYVVKDDGKYRLSLRFLHHGGQLRERIPVYSHGRSVARDLSKETGELVNLAVEEDGRGAVIFMSRGEDTAVDMAPVGKYAYLHQPAYGKAILAEFSHEKVDEVIEKWGLRAVTANTITSRDALHAELEESRERGYTIERDEGDVGISCIGASICNESGNPVGAISATIPSNKLRDETVESQLSQKILNAANIIELKIKQR